MVTIHLAELTYLDRTRKQIAENNWANYIMSTANIHISEPTDEKLMLVALIALGNLFTDGM